MENKKKRKNYFVDKKYQGEFVLRFCLVVLVSSFSIGLFIYINSQQSTTVAIENTKVVVKTTADFIRPVMTQVIVIVSFFSALVVAVLTVFTSHKISGPLFRMRRESESLKEGDLTRNFTIRAKDQLQELSRSLNSMGSALRQKHVELKEKSLALKKYLKDKDFSVTPQEKEDLEKLLDEIDEALKYFKV